MQLKIRVLLRYLGMLFMLQFENIRKLLEAAVRPKLREPFYTTTVCVNLVFAAFRTCTTGSTRIFCLKRCCSIEDIRVRNQRGRVPIADVVVKRSSGSKHVFEVAYSSPWTCPNSQ